MPLCGGRILRQAQNKSLRQAQDKFEPRLNRGGISLTLNAPEAHKPATWPTDSKTRILKIKKRRNYNQLILHHSFKQLLVSFGNVWKYLTLTGTIWAQFSFLNIKNKIVFRPWSAPFPVEKMHL
jgi:hypothetical protein